MNKLLVILGSTSTGKTDLALSLAKKFDGELVACDSRQVYKGLDIGTGKDGASAWMYDVADPKAQYSVYDYVKDASQVISEIEKRNKLPIIVGGTGLYLKALLEGLPNLQVPINIELRKKLEKKSLQDLQKELQKLSLKKWSSMNYSDKQNPRRLIRAIEIAKSINRLKIYDLRLMNKDVLKIGLTAPRKILYQKIDKRVIDRIKQGMIEEAKNLHKKGLSFSRMKQLGLEYGVLADYLSGKIKSQEELIKILQGKIHGYARRQLTWFKKEQNVCWLDIADSNLPYQVEKIVAKWYY